MVASENAPGVCNHPATWGIEYAAWTSKLNYEEMIDIAAATGRFESVEHFKEPFGVGFRANLPVDPNGAHADVSCRTRRKLYTSRVTPSAMNASMSASSKPSP